MTWSKGRDRAYEQAWNLMPGLILWLFRFKNALGCWNDGMLEYWI